MCLGPPWQDLERRGIRPPDNVAFFDIRVTLDAGSIESETFVESSFQLCRGYRETLQEAEYIREPYANEPDIFFLNHPDYIIFCCHDISTFVDIPCIFVGTRSPVNHFLSQLNIGWAFHYI